MRLFVAIPAPAEVKSALVELQQEARAGFAGVPNSASRKVDEEAGRLLSPRADWHFTRPEQLHLTLQFLGGERTVHEAHEAEKALEKVAFPAFSMPCAGLGAFPAERRASVLWAGVGGGQVLALARAAEAALAPAGFAPDKPFLPHVTFARNRFGADAREFLEKRREMTWFDGGWNVDSFCLFESARELGGGYEHEVVREYRLGPAIAHY